LPDLPSPRSSPRSSMPPCARTIAATGGSASCTMAAATLQCPTSGSTCRGPVAGVRPAVEGPPSNLKVFTVAMRADSRRVMFFLFSVVSCWRCISQHRTAMGASSGTVAVALKHEAAEEAAGESSGTVLARTSRGQACRRTTRPPRRTLPSTSRPARAATRNGRGADSTEDEAAVARFVWAVGWSPDG
jgi:hypothetical protein